MGDLWKRVCDYLQGALGLVGKAVAITDPTTVHWKATAQLWADLIADLPQGSEVAERLRGVAHDPGEMDDRPHPAMEAAKLIRLALGRRGRPVDLASLPAFTPFLDASGALWGVQSVLPHDPGDSGVYSFVCETGEQRRLVAPWPDEPESLPEAELLRLLDSAEVTHPPR